MRKSAACLVFVLLVSTVPSTSAKPQGDWTSLKNFIDQEIAIKTKNGVTHFGILRFSGDSEIRAALADSERLAVQETSFKRDDVVKIWRATLRFGETNIGKGALIGAGTGLGAGLLTAIAMAKSGSSDPPHGFGLFVIVGAGLGAIVGATKLKKHKKRELIYSI